MVGNIDVATETVRRLATRLRPPALDHLGLAAAIELEAAALARRTGLRCRVTGRLPTAGTPERTTAVFRIVQEALVNVVRHAGASAVRIVMRETPEALSVKIHDNGRGITGPELDDPRAIGLLGMRERAELIGGQLLITAQRGKGTAILITVPMASEPHVERA
jgi:signal transduction histidine kinase